MNKKVNTKTILIVVGLFMLLFFIFLSRPNNFVSDFINLQVLHKETTIEKGVYGHVTKNGKGISTTINIKDLAFGNEYSVTSGLDGFYQISLNAGDYSIIPDAEGLHSCTFESTNATSDGFMQTLSPTCKVEVRETAVKKDFSI